MSKPLKRLNGSTEVKPYTTYRFAAERGDRLRISRFAPAAVL